MNKVKRYIAIPRQNNKKTLVFESLKELCEFFNISRFKLAAVIEDGRPVSMGNSIYYIDEDLFE